jgi:AmpD protein
MTMEADSGRLNFAQWIPSPNFDARPAGVEPELIVIHGISLPPNQFGGDDVVKLFTNQLDFTQDAFYAGLQGLEVSAHLYIRRDGSLIQFVDFNQRAWHAGISLFEGRTRCNDFSIGIELEGSDFTCYTASQYHALANAIAALLEAFPRLSKQRIVGHSDIAPGRKTDPGRYFNWKALNRLLS